MLRFNILQLPCFSVWKNTTAAEDGYVTGIEPGTNFPNPRSFEGEKGRVVTLEGKASATFALGIDYLPNETAVSKAEQSVDELRTAEPIVHTQPLDDWCAT